MSKMNNLLASRNWHDRPIWGIWLMLASILIHFLGTVFEKILLQTYPVLQMAFIRSLFRLIPLFILLIKTNDIKSILTARQPFYHVLRVLAHLSYTYCILYALSKGSLTTAIAFQHITPFFILIFSAFLLKEKMDKNKWISVALATVGVLIGIRPTYNIDIIALLVICASIFGSLNKILIRKLTATENSITITLYSNLAIILIPLPIMLMNWHPVHWNDLLYFLIAGIFAGIAQFTAVQALRFAQASSLASLDCSGIVWCTLFDYCFWQIIPSIYLLIGSGIIITSNIYLLKSTKKQSLVS